MLYILTVYDYSHNFLNYIIKTSILLYRNYTSIKREGRRKERNEKGKKKEVGEKGPLPDDMSLKKECESA